MALSHVHRRSVPPEQRLDFRSAKTSSLVESAVGLNALSPVSVLLVDPERTPTVPQLAHAAEHQAGREPVGAPVMARVQLTQNRQQRVAPSSIDLIDQQHKWPGVGLGPALQRIPQSRVRTPFGQRLAPDLR